jgi:hypothetical protein
MKFAMLSDETGETLSEFELDDNLAESIEDLLGITKFRQEKWEEFIHKALEEAVKRSHPTTEDQMRAARLALLQEEEDQS